jgi:hypothetical protein
LVICRILGCWLVTEGHDSLCGTTSGAINLDDCAVRLPGIRPNSSSRKIPMKVFCIFAGLPLDALVAGEKTSGEAIYQDWAGEAFLD